MPFHCQDNQFQTPELSTLKTYPIDALLKKFSGLGYQNLMLVRRQLDSA
jgi:hypothetical protein